MRRRAVAPPSPLSFAFASPWQRRPAPLRRRPPPSFEPRRLCPRRAVCALLRVPSPPPLPPSPPPPLPAHHTAWFISSHANDAIAMEMRGDGLQRHDHSMHRHALRTPSPKHPRTVCFPPHLVPPSGPSDVSLHPRRAALTLPLTTPPPSLLRPPSCVRVRPCASMCSSALHAISPSRALDVVVSRPPPTPSRASAAPFSALLVPPRSLP
ncbi:hypothetical protein DENSPDRAFT_934723, partial [Dentipellis sp. KUC8613]